VKISIRGLLWAAAASAAVLGSMVPASGDGQIGDDKWCAVVDQGSGALQWDCEYDTVQNCAPAVVQGNRGFCALNPSYQPPPPDPQSSMQPLMLQPSRGN